MLLMLKTPTEPGGSRKLPAIFKLGGGNSVVTLQVGRYSTRDSIGRAGPTAAPWSWESCSCGESSPGLRPEENDIAGFGMISEPPASRSRQSKNPTLPVNMSGGDTPKTLHTLADVREEG